MQQKIQPPIMETPPSSQAADSLRRETTRANTPAISGAHAIPAGSTSMRVGQKERFFSYIQDSVLVRIVQDWFARSAALPYSGPVTLVVGTTVITVVLLLIRQMVPLLPTPGVGYLPLIAMLAYYWSWGRVF